MSAGPPSSRWLFRWLVGLNLVLIAAALVIGALRYRRALVIAAFIPVAFVPFAYARLRIHRLLAGVLPGGALTAVALLGMLFDLAMAGQLVTGRDHTSAPWLHGGWAAWIGPVWFSAHALAFLGYAVVGLARALVRAPLRARVLLRRWFRPPLPTTVADAPDAEPALGRRQVLQQFALVGAVTPFAVSLSGVPLSYDFRVEERELELPEWPRQLDGLRVAHLSDIHVGGAMNRERLLRVAELTNAARPDVVLHTGDFLTHRGGDFDAPLYEALARIVAPQGQWACLGNHDFDDPDGFTRRLRDAGVVTLRNALTIVRLDGGQPLELAGLDFAFDRGQRGAILARQVGRLPARAGAPRLLLNHDPSTFGALPDGCADLVLSGHTHGGHIGVQLGRDRALTVVGLAGFPDQGVFRRGDMRLFVTRCVGFYGYPMRVGIPPEIAVLVLRAPGATRVEAARERVMGTGRG